MKTLELIVTRIGNSRGIRLPADLIRRYRIGQSVLLEERAGEIVLRPKKQTKLSWADTFAAMAAEKEDWSAWDGVAGDGLHDA